jgi:hypothetical protein
MSIELYSSVAQSFCYYCKVKEILGAIAAILTFVGYVPYIRETLSEARLSHTFIVGFYML